MDDLSKVVYRTVHKRNKSVEELADELGVSASTLYRVSNPNDDQARLAVQYVLPLMRLTGDHSILRHLAGRTGHVLFKVPRGSLKKARNLNEFQKTFSACLEALCNYRDGDISREACLEKIDEHLSETAGLRRDVQKYDQAEFEFSPPKKK